MLGAREQRRGVADRPRRRLAAVPRGDDAVEARRIALDAGHDDDRAAALGEDRAGEVVEGRRPAGLDLLDHDEVEAAREGRRVHRLNGVRIVIVDRLGFDPGGAGLGDKARQRRARLRVARFAIAAHRRVARLERAVSHQRQVAARPQRRHARFDALGERKGVGNRRPVGFLQDDENVFEHVLPREARGLETEPFSHELAAKL